MPAVADTFITQNVQDGVVVVGFVVPRILPEDEEAMREQFSDISRDAETRMIIDLTGVIILPSDTLGMLTTLRKQCKTFVLCCMAANIREMLEVTHLDRLFTLAVDLPTALELARR